MTLTQTGTPAAPHAPQKTVMIVDDSRVMRDWLRAVLSNDPRLNVVAEAKDAEDARDQLRDHPVDVLTLDIEMPGMNGIAFLGRLMRARPMPVVMFSSHTAEGSDAAIRSLSLGAVDCMVKPTRGFGPELMNDLCERVYQAACTRASSILAHRNALATKIASHVPQNKPYANDRRGSIILIGASTGGVAALEALLPGLRPDGPPVVIVQHMPGNFLKSFAGRLDRMLPQNVVLASENLTLSRGDIVLAPGEGQHTGVRRRAGTWHCRFVPNDPPALHCPSVDVLFHSAVSEGKNVAAAILTGLGRDGAEGLSALRSAGAQTYGQNEATCVVYGMPRAAKALGAIERELPPDKIAKALSQSFMRKSAEHAEQRVAT